MVLAGNNSERRKQAQSGLRNFLYGYDVTAGHPEMPTSLLFLQLLSIDATGGIYISCVNKQSEFGNVGNFTTCKALFIPEILLQYRLHYKTTRYQWLCIEGSEMLLHNDNNVMLLWPARPGWGWGAIKCKTHDKPGPHDEACFKHRD